LMGTERPSTEALAPTDGSGSGPVPAWFASLPTATLVAARAQAAARQAALHSAAHYRPAPDCFFKGEDPLLLVRQTPGLAGLWTDCTAPWPAPEDFDPYRSNLQFTLLSSEAPDALREHFRYVEDQVDFHVPLSTHDAAVPADNADRALLDELASGRGDGTTGPDDAASGARGATLGPGDAAPAAWPAAALTTAVVRVRSAGQSFGLPRQLVIAPLQVARTAVHTIRKQRTAVLPDRLVRLYALNDLLGIPAGQQRTAEQAFTVLLVRLDGEVLGLMVDACLETLDISLAPVDGAGADLIGYAGTALLGDGSLLMVLNLKELL